MHLKNLALLKTAEPDQAAFNSVRMAPLYDAVPTRVFPNLAHDRMALKLNGKDDNLRRADFTTLAATARLKTTAADELFDELCAEMKEAIDSVTLPALASSGQKGKETADQALEIMRPAAGRLVLTYGWFPETNGSEPSSSRVSLGGLGRVPIREEIVHRLILTGERQP